MGENSACAHLTVRYSPLNHLDGSFSESWECASCCGRFNIREPAILRARAAAESMRERAAKAAEDWGEGNDEDEGDATGITPVEFDAKYGRHDRLSAAIRALPLEEQAESRAAAAEKRVKEAERRANSVVCAINVNGRFYGKDDIRELIEAIENTITERDAIKAKLSAVIAAAGESQQ